MLRASFMTSSSESQAIIPGAATDWVESRSGNSDKRNRNGNRNSAQEEFFSQIMIAPKLLI